MARKKVSTQVYLDPEDCDRLQRLKDRTRVPTALRIRDAIREYLDRVDPPAKDAGKPGNAA